MRVEQHIGGVTLTVKPTYHASGMYRSISPDDTVELMSLLQRVGLFESHQLIELKEMLADYFGGVSDDEKFWILDYDEDQSLVGVGYCQAERMTNGTWNLQLLGISPDVQGQGTCCR
jgi:hypothetical protein